MENIPSPYFYFFLPEKMTIRHNTLQGVLQHSKRPVPTLKLTLAIYQYGIIHFSIEEINPARVRFKAGEHGPIIIEEKLAKLPLSINTSGSEVITIKAKGKEEFAYMRDDNISITDNEYEVTIQIKPFLFEYKVNGQKVMVVNKYNLLNYEEYRNSTEQKQYIDSQYDATKFESETENLWEESFKDQTFAVPYGPTSVALDFDFPLNHQLYGLPEHCHKFALPSTQKTNSPFRFFNVDVYDYESDSRMALYGTIPYVLSYSPSLVFFYISSLDNSNVLD